MISFRRALVLMLTIMGSMAEFERSLTKARCDEGIAKARRQAKKFGRPSALDDGQRRKIAERYAIGETKQLASEYEVGVASIWRALNPSPFAEAAQAARSERRDVEIAGTAFRRPFSFCGHRDGPAEFIGPRLPRSPPPSTPAPRAAHQQPSLGIGSANWSASQNEER
jgi:hypothetical protein